MPAKSDKQRRLMTAAKAGADFPLAKQVRASMTDRQLTEFAQTSSKNLPEHGRGNRYHPSRRGKA